MSSKSHGLKHGSHRPKHGSHRSKHGSTCSRSSEGSLGSIEYKKCVYLPCTSCKLWHCDCTPCGHYRKALPSGSGRMDFLESRMPMCRRDCRPSCSRCRVREDHMHRINTVSYHDVTHRVHEEDICIDREDISQKACHRGRVFNVCRAYVGEEDERVVVKWVREGHDCEKDHYWEAIKQAKETAKIVRAFMSETDTHGWKVKVLIPKNAQGWLRRKGHHTHVLVERYLRDYEVFYKKSDDIHLWHGHMCFMVMEALMHFSIRHSQRKSMISNLKGFVDKEEKIIYLSGPSVLDHKLFGDGDGVISAFLREHNCSRMCR